MSSNSFSSSISQDEMTLLRSGWFEYLKISCVDDGATYEESCHHIHGYDKEQDESFQLSVLQIITARRVLDYKEIEKAKPAESIQHTLDDFLQTNGPIINLIQQIKRQSPAMTLAAEFKRASPSKGLINPDVSAGSQAVQYYTAGASVISILTEERWFKGSMKDLTEARLHTQQKQQSNQNNMSPSSQSRPVILRKDFIITTYQILEAASAGADTVLLIVAVTPAPLLKTLIEFCRSLKMEPLVEVHAPAELNVAIQSGAKVIGVNNRNLHTFQMDLATTDRTAVQLKAMGINFHHGDNKTNNSDNQGGNSSSDNDKDLYALCALSGMSTAQDVHRYRQLGVGMVLIGESLMRSHDPKMAISALCLHPDQYHKNHLTATGGGAYVGGTKIVKVCGITNPEDALVACRSGANLIGIIFAEKSKRKVNVTEAKKVVEAVRQFGERDSRATFTDIFINSNQPTKEAVPALLMQKAQALQQVATSHRPLVVGVFQNQSSEFIAKMVQEAGIDLVQLHGSEGMEAAAPQNCGGVPALRVVDIPADSSLSPSSTSAIFSEAKTKDDAVTKIIDGLTSDPLAILLDTTMKGGQAGGGTGKTFDWGIAESIQNRGLPVIIAGGLKPENIRDAVAGVRPWGVDVSSGVEQSPGKKDVEKVKTFVSEARSASDKASQGF